MDKFDIFKNCKCLYTPKGAAREYARVGCNFYRGCPYQCAYCYNRKGITSGIMGVDHAVLESCFVSRPKKFRDMSAESYALMCFVNEVDAHLDYLRDMGVFFSFSTDPWLSETRDLTWKCATFAALKGIPVKILTKCAVITDEVRLYASSLLKQFVSFGFTLTGRDDLEPNASTNQERVAAMRELHEMGYKTFASIEPIVDFASSYRMIKETAGFCDQYLIGLMSKRGKEYPPYDRKECIGFIKKVMALAGKQPEPFKVYWKDSISDFVRGSVAARRVMWHEDIYADRRYCLQYGTVSYPIHTLVNEVLPAAVDHLEALLGEPEVRERKAHELELIKFFCYFENTNSLIDYCEYLAHQDIPHLQGLAEKGSRDAARFVKLYESGMNSQEEIPPFITKLGKHEFSVIWLYILAIHIRRIFDAVLADLGKLE